MADPFVAEIRMFPFTFPPKGWAFCDGQLLPISQNTALFALVGTFYGGDGKSTFGLPGLQGRTPVHVGADQPGQGLSLYDLGEIGGVETVTLLQSETPVHSHAVQVQGTDPGDVAEVTPSVSSFAPSIDGLLYQPAPNGGNMLAPQALTPSGGDLPHNNVMPTLTVSFCIALQGVFPPRN